MRAILIGSMIGVLLLMLEHLAFSQPVTITGTVNSATGASTPYSVDVSISGGGGGGGGAVSIPFTPLHTYYLSPAGNDANAGTSPASSWKTLNHPVACGDVIIAATGNYDSANFSNNWGTVSGCPSTSGGIDGTGGIYFAVLLCGGADLEACQTTNKSWNINKSNWAVEGWKSSKPGTGYADRVFDPTGGAGSIHHVAFINDIAFNTAQGFHTDASITNGVDYFAVIGSFAQNASQEVDYPGSSIDAVNQVAFDSAAGSHIVFYGNIVSSGLCPTCPYDSEAFMLDSWGQNNYPNQGIIVNNLAFNNARYCIQVVGSNGTGTGRPPMKFYNNTCYGNNVNTRGDWADGEINLGVSANNNWPVTITDNIILTRTLSGLSLDGQGGSVYGLVVGNSMTAVNVSGNIFKGQMTSCRGTAGCDPGFNNASFGTLANLNVSANTYIDPGLNDTADLFRNRLGTPVCSGFVSVTQCAGYDATTKALSRPSIIYDLQPTAAAATTKGYQLPSTTCMPSGTGVVADYPGWLKGIVYLHAEGNTVTQRKDLVTLPCGL